MSMEQLSKTFWCSAPTGLWLALILATPARGDDWPAWRGGAQEARVSHAAGLLRWSETEGVA